MHGDLPHFAHWCHPNSALHSSGHNRAPIKMYGSHIYGRLLMNLAVCADSVLISAASYNRHKKEPSGGVALKPPTQQSHVAICNFPFSFGDLYARRVVKYKKQTIKSGKAFLLKRDATNFS